MNVKKWRRQRHLDGKCERASLACQCPVSTWLCFTTGMVQTLQCYVEVKPASFQTETNILHTVDFSQKKS